MVVNGDVYTSDLIIFPDKINPSWWRKSGHQLCLEDLESVFSELPDAIVIGTGFMGAVKVKEEVIQTVNSKGILLIIEKTKKAVHVFNDLSSNKKTVGAFHLTC